MSVEKSFQWIVSDTHFGHDNILKYEPERLAQMKRDGFRDQTQWLIWRWNQVVGEQDHVLHLGDFAFKMKADKVLPQLNGSITLLLGNHEAPEKIRRLAAESQGKLTVVEGIDGQPADDVWISALTLPVGDKKVFFSHYPLVTKDPYARGRTLQIIKTLRRVYRQGGYDCCVHGHVHSKDAHLDPRREINVSIERTGFQPLPWAKLERRILYGEPFLFE